MELIKSRALQYATVSRASTSHEESLDAIVPDTFPDIETICCALGSLEIREKLVQTDRVMVSGNIRGTLVYKGEQGGPLCALDCTIPFAALVEARGCKGQDLVFVKGSLHRLEGRMLNPRKFTLRAQFGLETQVCAPKEYEVCQGIRGGEEEGMQALTQTFSFESALSMKEKGFSLHEDVRQKSPEGSTGDKVLRTFGKLVTEDIRVISGKVMLRGSAQGEALLLRQSTGAMEKESFSIPYSQIVELEGAEEGDTAQVEYSVKNCACTVSSDEEGPFLSWDIAADVMVSIHRPVQYEVLMDAFSIKGGCTLQQEPLDLPLARCQREASAEMRATLSPPEQADALLDWSASVKSCGAIGKEGVAHGEVCVNLLCMTGDGQPMQYDQVVSWEGHFPPMEGEDCLCQCDISGLSLKWADGACQLTGPVAFHLTGQSGKPVRQVVDCQMEENASAPARPKASLILRRAEGGETVWLLAKSFRTSPGDIMAANHLETGGALEKGQLVMIPFQR